MDEIDDLAFSVAPLKQFFLGAFPADINPPMHDNTCCWICNTDKQN